jgi:hypothetical protein
MLKDSIGGNCKTILIANIWPEVAHLEVFMKIIFKGID